MWVKNNLVIKGFQKTSLSRRLRSIKHRGLEFFGAEIRNRRKQWIVEINQPLVIISEVQRSGGTLLSQLLDGHPECYSHPEELCWGKPEKWNWPALQLDSKTWLPNQLFKQLHEPWIDAYGGAGFYRKKPGYKTQYPFLFDLTLQRSVFRDIMRARPFLSQRDVFNAYLTSFFSAWLDCSNLYGAEKKFITCFTPRLIVETPVERIFSDYPDGYVVSLVRDPVDWFLSARNHAFFRNAGSTDQLLGYWNESTEAAIQAHAKFPTRVIVGRFESLVRDTQAAMSELCRRVGIGFSDTSLGPSFNGIPIRSNSSFRSVYGVDKSVIDRREQRKELDERTTKEVIQKTKKTLQRVQDCLAF